MKNRTVLLIVCAILMMNLVLVQVANAKPAYCQKALNQCTGDCRSMSFFTGILGGITGQAWIPAGFGLGCVGGCYIGYAGCGS